MPKFQTKPNVIEAAQWWKNGNHPEDGPADREGQVVRYFRHPYVPGDTTCSLCQRTYQDHGWIDHGSDGVQVCPGDYVITGEDGKYGVMRGQAFEEMYEPLVPEALAPVFVEGDRVRRIPDGLTGTVTSLIEREERVGVVWDGMPKNHQYAAAVRAELLEVIARVKGTPE